MSSKIKNSLAPSRIKGNITHLGNSIGNSIGTEYQQVSNKFHKGHFDSDDELISEYQHDLKRSMKALKYILNQIHRLHTTGYPRMFKTHMKAVESFGKIIGAGSLNFKGIEEFYQEFDKLQAESEVPLVHPKEREFEIPAINEQLYNYMMSIDRLASRTLDDWDLFYQENKLRIVEFNDYLKGVLKLIAKRNKKEAVYQKTHKKLEKLMKKTSLLDDKEQKQMVVLEKDLREAKYIFEKLDEKVKTTLPHVVLLLEEFIDSLAKIILCKQVETMKSISDTLDYFTVYYGLKSGKIDDYETISESWENAMTPVRLQLESFISIIHDKNPELIDQEIDDEDKTSKTAKFWNKMTKKMTEKSFDLKVDHTNGLFNGNLIVDPLDAFIEYQNPNSNRSNTYFPIRLPEKIEIPHISDKDRPTPPPLPPRLNTAKEHAFGFTQRGAPLSLPSSPSLNMSPTMRGNGFNSIDKTVLDSDSESYDSDSLMSDKDEDYDDRDDEDMSLLTTNSISTSNLVKEVDRKDNSKLMKVYNSSKNDISEAPIFNHVKPIELLKGDVFTKSSTLSHKVDELTSYFDKVLSLEANETHMKLKARHSFTGAEPGDLSFEKDDIVEVVYEFYDFIKDKEPTWLLAKAGSRVGLVPSNYFD